MSTGVIANVALVTDREAIRREVVTGLIARAQQRAAGHERNFHDATEHGDDAMALRAEANWNAWLEVARILKAGEV